VEDKKMCDIHHHFSGKLTIQLFVLPTIVLIVVLGAQDVLAGQTFTVTNTKDSGAGSLRQAILEANAVLMIELDGNMAGVKFPTVFT
jgi:hypothetical protein